MTFLTLIARGLLLAAYGLCAVLGTGLFRLADRLEALQCKLAQRQGRPDYEYADWT